MIHREFSLAVACCRWSFSGQGAEDIRQLATAVDWPTFLETIRRHRVQAVVNLALEKNDISPLARIHAEISRDASAIAVHNLRSARECIRLHEAFSNAGIPLLFIKGLTLSALAYGDPYLKMSVDIDVLIGLDDVGRASELLTRLGHRLVTPAVDPNSPAIAKWHVRHKESVWHGLQSKLAVDLHTRLSDNPALIPKVGISSPQRDIAIGPGHTLPTLGPDDLFAHLCVHGASGGWFRLKWIADFAALLCRSTADEIERLYDGALQRNAGRAPALALLLADRLFALPFSDGFRADLMSDVVNRLLLSAALRELLKATEPTDRLLGTAASHLMQPFLVKGWRFKIDETRRQLVDIAERRLGLV